MLLRILDIGSWLALLLALSIVLTGFVVYWRRTNVDSHRLSLRFICIYVGLCIAFPVFAVYASSNGFGPGAFLFLSSLATVPLALIVIVVRAISLVRVFWQSPIKIGTFIILSLMLVVLQASSFYGGAIIINTCDAANQRKAEVVINAISHFSTQQEHYPPNIDALVPQYLKEVPSPSCVLPYQILPDFDVPTYRIQTCENRRALTIDSLRQGWRMRYILDDDEWYSLDFLDGYCE